MKRLRHHLGEKKLKYYMCGEYGEKNRRPHYHACLFGHDFEDKKLYSVREGIPLYLSDSLTSIWSHGFTTLGDVTFESAAYVARYIMKKITLSNKTPKEYIRHGKLKNYERVNPETGEVLWVEPEYTNMSRAEGIGKSWFEKYGTDVFPHDYVVVNGKKIKPPRYYDERYKEIDEVKIRRIQKAIERAVENTEERLKVKEVVKIAQLTQLRRDKV